MAEITQGDPKRLDEAATDLGNAAVKVGIYLNPPPTAGTVPEEKKKKKKKKKKHRVDDRPEGESAEEKRNRLDLEIIMEEIEDVQGRLMAVQRRLDVDKRVTAAVAEPAG